MKILIADDMEGITGVVDWTHVDPSNAEYQRFRKIMTADVNAAIRGGFDAGATEVLVSDGHGPARNVLVEELDSRASLNSGGPNYMVRGIEDGIDALMMVGYHPMAGTLGGILCHTWSLSVLKLWLNDLLVGEMGLNASLAGYYGVPLIMVSSCQAGCEEAAKLVPGVETVAVKKGSSQFAAECLPPAVSQLRIQEAAARAVKNFKSGKNPAPIKTSNPIFVKVELAQTIQADKASILPFVKRLDGRTVVAEAADMPTAHRMFRSIVSIG